MLCFRFLVLVGCCCSYVAAAAASAATLGPEEAENEEAQVEPSSLTQRRANTHDGSGFQFNFVQDEVEKVSGATAGDSANGGVPFASAGESSGLIKSLIKSLEAIEGSALQAKLTQTQKPTLPLVESDAPLSSVLRSIRTTLLQMGGTGAPRSYDAEPRRSGPHDDIGEHLRNEGLDRLESSLLDQVPFQCAARAYACLELRKRLRHPLLVLVRRSYSVSRKRGRGGFMGVGHREPLESSTTQHRRQGGRQPQRRCRLQRC